MTAFHCPKCEISFRSKTELDHHCRVDHPQFHHEYRASPPRGTRPDLPAGTPRTAPGGGAP